MKRNKPMPNYYRKNIAQHAQKKFLDRRAREREAGERSPEAGQERRRTQ